MGQYQSVGPFETRQRPRVGKQSAGFLPTDWLLLVVDLALLGVVFVAPFFMGGRHPLGRLVYVVLSVVAAGAWLIHQSVSKSARWTRCPAGWLLLLGAAVVAVQLVPLPPNVLSQISPHLFEHLGLWGNGATSSADLGQWSQISLAPSATRGGLVLYAAMALLLIVTFQRCRTLRDVERVMHWIGLSALLMAVVGVVQYFSPNGKFVWVYQHPYRDTYHGLCGSFINRNHFTHMLALGIGPLILWVVTLLDTGGQRSEVRGLRSEANQRARQIVFLLVLALACVYFAGLMSRSRGGAVAMAVATLIVAVGFYRVRLISGALLGTGLAAVAVLLAASLFIHGYDRVAERLSDLTSASVDQLDHSHGRRKIWQADLKAVTDSPLLGTGVGSQSEVYPMYMPDPPITEYTHAESGYLQIAVETGLAGLIVVLCFMMSVGWCCVSVLCRAESRRLKAVATVVLAAAAASASHSLVDFVWYIPACLSLTAMLIACGFRVWHLAQPDVVQHRRTFVLPSPAWIGATALLCLLGTLMITNRVGPALASRHWDDYLRESLAMQKWQQSQLNNTATDLDFLTEPGKDTHDASMIHDLVAVVRHDRENARAHLRLAAHYLRLFDQLQRSSENAMDLSQIRDAAIASSFPNRAALDEWLGRAVGDRRQLLDQALWHTKRGLQLCPLQGVGYVYLARLCFLEVVSSETKLECIAQALQLRPYDGDVLFEAGKESLLAGDPDAAQAHWRRCFHAGSVHQLKLTKMLIPRVSLAELIEAFDPDAAELALLYRQCKGRASDGDLDLLCRRYEQQVEHIADSPEAADLAARWCFASRMRRCCGQYDKAVANARRACESDPSHYDSHHELAVAAIGARQYPLARDQLRWCLQRKPNLEELQRMLDSVVRAADSPSKPLAPIAQLPGKRREPIIER